MELLVVRHAHAGSKDRWRREDRIRPLSRRGRAQARSLAGALAGRRPVRIVSSPYLRCIETVGPLAARLGVVVEEADELRPDADGDAGRLVRRLARDADDGPVLVCTHGETIMALQADLGAARRTAFAPGGAHEKGSVWVLRTAGGELTSAFYVPPGVALGVGVGGAAVRVATTAGGLGA